MAKAPEGGKTLPQTGYDASLYSPKGSPEGKAAWEEAGKPPYDSQGRELDKSGWPTGKMQGASGARLVTPAEFMGQKPWTVEVNRLDDVPQVMTFDVPKEGVYTMDVGPGVSDVDLLYTIASNGEVIGTFSGRQESFTLHKGEATVSVRVNPDSQAVKLRVAKGEMAASGVYILRPVPQ